jgi:uncharacterized protein
VSRRAKAASLPGPVGFPPGSQHWGIAHAVVGWVAAFVIGGIAGGSARAMGFRGTGPVVAGVAGLWLGMLGACWHASRRRGRGSWQDDFAFRFQRTDVAIGLSAGLVTQLAAIPLLYWPIKQFIDLDLERPARTTLDTANGAAMVVLIIVIGFGAPIVEEVFFRGLLYGAVNRRTGVINSIVVSSLIFAATHFQVAQFPGLFLAGVVFAGVRAWYGRLGPAIVTHAVFNLTTLAALLADRS